ncbi:HAD family hydrolase [Neorhizobium sp. Rsf11]|uniref:phosphoserine phosphatase n=2 Tax=Neorhizobium TaxID=1525371 RepID=A0ABV0MCB8_9HYPH|nr:HAD family hydrolase [Neorhizobium petrolearium]MCC2614193.1 haloacid dehalogenase-like hydrolase [Neorhizobium petrolearium]WGI71703.1 HAD family hydrolase [Neorhizobium petrolearium]
MIRQSRNIDAVLASLLVAFVLLLLGLLRPALAQEPLPSWNDTSAKTRIMEFVQRSVTEGGEGYVAPVDRIAVFDNDGTLWSEQPYYFQLGFVLDRVQRLAPQHPEWKEKEPYKSVLANDLAGVARNGEKELVDLGMATHAGMTTDEFNKIVTDWFATARHPKTGKPFDEMTFLPMRELLEYLRANGFRTFIVSGGGIEFMRPITEKAYGIPPEQVIGSTIRTEFALVGNVPVLRRLPAIDFIDDGPGKPVGINQFIGRRPVFVAGNSDGDYEMLRWVTGGKQHGFAMIIHHTDGEREYAYDRNSAFGRLDKALNEAERRNWLVVDMKADWKKVYAFEN